MSRGCEYRWKPGARIKADPQAVGQWIDGLRDADGSVTAAEVADAAADPGTPAHMVFIWDDEEAAHEHRLNQARHIIRCLQVKIVTSKSEVITQAYQIVTHDSGERYTDIGEVMTHKDWRDELLERAASELDAFTRKYERLEELAGLVRQIRRWLVKR